MLIQFDNSTNPLIVYNTMPFKEQGSNDIHTQRGHTHKEEHGGIHRAEGTEVGSRAARPWLVAGEGNISSGW